MIKILVKNKRAKKYLVILLILLTLFGLIKLVVHILNSPVNGTVAVQRSVNPVVHDNNDYSTLSNDFYSLLYPTGLTPDLPDQKVANVQGYSFLTERDANKNITTSLEVYMKSLPSGGVTLDSDYQKYASDKTYKMSTTYSHGELVDVAKKDKGSHERIAIWVHGSNILIMKLSSNTKDDLDINFSTILKSIQILKS